MKRTLLALLVLGMAPLVASAATLTYTLTYDGSMLGDFSGPAPATADMLFNSGPNPAGYDPSWIHVFSLSVSVSGLSAGQDLLGGGHQLLTGTGVTGLGYAAGPNPSYQYFDRDKKPFPGNTTENLFKQNIDAGTSDADMYGIVFEFTSNGIINHVQPAESTPLFLGNIYATWNGAQTSSMSTVAMPGDAWVIWFNNQLGTSPIADTVSQSSSTVEGATVVFGAGIPEPATLALLAIGSAGMLLRRRRTA